jgi:hypothetical protein
MGRRLLPSILLICLATGRVPAQEAAVFDVVVSLSPSAAEALGRTGESLIVSAWYYADPRAGAEARANARGLIDLGTEEHRLDGMGGTVALGSAPLDIAAYSDIGGPVQVNINIFAGEGGSPDTRLACDFFDGPVARASLEPVALRCSLVREGLRPEAKS